MYAGDRRLHGAVFGLLHARSPPQRRALSRHRFSIALPLGINAPTGRFTGSLYPVLRLLRFAEPRGPDASPSGGPQCSHAHCELPGVRPVLTSYKRRRCVLSLDGSPPAESGTSSVELQSAAWGGGELHGSSNRNCNAPFCKIRPRPKARPSSPPRVRLTAAPLPLRRILPSPAGISSRFCCRKMSEIPL